MRSLIVLALQIFAVSALAQTTPVLLMSSDCRFGTDEGKACIDYSGRMGFCLSEPAPEGGTGTGGSSCVAPVQECSDEDVEYQWPCTKPEESQLGVCRKGLEGGNVCSYQDIEYVDSLVGKE